MRQLLVVGLLAACSSPAARPAPVIASAAVPQPLVAPSVASAAAFAVDPPEVPAIVIVDEQGLGVIPPPDAWSGLAKIDRASAEVVEHAGPHLHDAAIALGAVLREGARSGRKPIESIARIGKPLGPVSQDDPPPPPPEDLPDDGNAESGGTGTAMALDEGKMGKRHESEVTGAVDHTTAPMTAHSVADGPERLAVAGGRIAEKLQPEQRALVIAAPTTSAATLIDVLAATDGLIGASYQGAIHALRLDLTVRPRDSGPWIELRVGPRDLAFEAVPEKPVAVASLDALANAYATTLAQRDLAAATIVDVLVDPQTDSQRLVDILVALDAIGVRAIGLGLAATGPQAAVRGHRSPRVMIGSPNLQGELDRSTIRASVKLHVDEITACYTAALAQKPKLQGYVAVQFVIGTDGKTSAIVATGSDDAVARCMGDVVKKTTFPRPKTGIVQVLVPMLLKS